MPFKPLFSVYPEFSDLTWLQRFLIGTPGLGPYRHLREDIVKQLRERDPDALSEWLVSNDMLQCVLAINDIVKEEMEWPNAHFIPQDPCELIFFDGRFVSESRITCFFRLQHEYGITTVRLRKMLMSIWNYNRRGFVIR
jgi:hypothetical protein